MKRSRAITLALVPSLASFLAACGHSGRRVCLDDGQTVIDSRACEPGGHVPYLPLGHWYYPSSGGYFPMGSRISGSGGSSSASPSGTVRGGIGASGEAHSSGGHSSGGAGE
ncbi:MAG TPA: hypothetical protein VGN17_06325 [Bryobacteraceae bacterium]